MMQRRYWLVALLGLSLQAFLYFGYVFPASDQAQYLLMGLKWASPDFCAGDWFTQQTTQWHYSFSAIVYLLEKMNFLAGGMFLVQCIAVVVGSAALLHFGKSLGLSLHATVVAAILVQLYFNFGVGSTQFFTAMFAPRSLANALFLFALSFGLRTDHMRAALCCALALLVHQNVGVLGIAVLSLFIILQNPSRWRSLGKPLAVFLVAGSPIIVGVVIPAAYEMLFAKLDPVAVEEALTTLFAWRSPHHYFPGHWVEEVVPFVALVVFGFILAQRLEEKRIRSLLVTINSILAITLLTGLLNPLNVLVRLYTWNLSMFVVIMAVFLLVHFIVSSSSPRGWFFRSGVLVTLLIVNAIDMRAFQWSLVAVAALFIVCESYKHIISRRTTWLAYGAFAATFVMIFIVYPLTIWRSIYLPVLLVVVAIVLPSKVGEKRTAMALVLFSLVYLSITVGPNSDRKWRFDYKPGTSVFADTMHWIRDHTPKDAVLVSNPAWAMVRVLSERGIVGNFKVTPLISIAEALEWKQRLEDLAGVEDVRQSFPPGFAALSALAEAYRGRGPEHISMLAEKYGATHFLTEIAHHHSQAFIDAGYQVLHVNKPFVILKIPRKTTGAF